MINPEAEICRESRSYFFRYIELSALVSLNLFRISTEWLTPFFVSTKLNKLIMKNLKNLFVALALCAPLTAIAQDIEINEENFPDEKFRNYLLRQDYGADGVITEAEIAGITDIDVGSQLWFISSLKGIEHFIALTKLNCEYNPLTSLDVSKNTALTYLNCFSNHLTSLDVSKNTALTYLYCSFNQFTSLDVSNNTALTRLWCYDNHLTSLDVSNNTALTFLSCYNNQLTSLDVSNNTALTRLDCYRNQIKGESMDALVSSLPETTNGRLYVYSEVPDHNEGNIITKSQVAAAKAKGWTSYYWGLTEGGGYAWQEYEGMDDTDTSIAQPEAGNSTAEVYTMHGKKVTAPQRGGIYVVNGKKVVVK